MKLKNKVTIIAGGSGGIGRVIAEFFAREGARVTILARDKKEIAKAIDEVWRATGVHIEGHVVDISDFAALRRVISGIAKKNRGVDILVNCAGVQPPIGAFADADIAVWEKNIAVNLFGTAHACKVTLPFMIKKKSGVIINFSGGGGTASRPNFSAYAAAKTAVVRLTEILADELKPHHVRVNCIAPGTVHTRMIDEIFAAGGRVPKEERVALKKKIESGGTPPEVAAALAVFLASSDSAPLSGRLISAPFDDWKKWDKKQIQKIMASEKFTLRRLK